MDLAAAAAGIRVTRMSLLWACWTQQLEQLADVVTWAGANPR